MKKQARILIKSTAVVALIAAVLYTVLSVLATRKLDMAYAALKADKRPMLASDVIPKEVPASENAAPLYKAAVLRLQAESSGDTDLFQQLAKLGYKVTSDTASAEEVATFRSLVQQDAVQEALQLVGRAAMRDQCWYDLNYSQGAALLLPHLGDLRYLSRILCAAARVQADTGNAEGAWDNTLTSVRLANALRDEPMLVSQFIRISQFGMAVDTIQHLCEVAVPTDRQIEKLRKALQDFEHVGPLVNAVDGDRLFFGDWFFRQANSGMTDEDAESLGISGWYFWLRPMLRADHAEYLDVMREYAAWASRPYESGDGEFVDALRDQVPFYCMQTRLMTSFLSDIKIEYLKMIARARITRVGLAVIAVIDRDGSPPNTLVDAGIDAPIDPFTGKPLIYRAEGKGFVLYSTGEDRADDGGTVPEETTDGEKDITWRYTGTSHTGP